MTAGPLRREALHARSGPESALREQSPPGRAAERSSRLPSSPGPAFHWPRAPRLFILARWAKARCAAATFSALARPGLLRRRLQRAAVGEGQRARAARRCLFMASRCAVASSSDWPPERNAMPGTAAGTQALSTLHRLLRHFFDAGALRRLLAGRSPYWA